MLQVFTNISKALLPVSFIECENKEKMKTCLYMKTYKTLANMHYADMYCCR